MQENRKDIIKQRTTLAIPRGPLSGICRFATATADPRQKPSGERNRLGFLMSGLHPTYNGAGFTLIELLVVVLIIGILAAVALPKYELAVAKARYMQLVSLANALHKGQQLYVLANGQASNDISVLDIELPPGTSNTSSTIYYKWGHCQIGSTGYAYCESTRDGVQYNDLGSVRQCNVKVGVSTETFAHKICKSFGGTPAVAADANGWLHYTLP